MDMAHKHSLLLDLAEEIGLDVRPSPPGAAGGDHPGGALVRLRGREILFIDPAAALADQVDAIASALAGRAELEDRYLPPELRQLLGED
jgi:hypothetical protein